MKASQRALTLTEVLVIIGVVVILIGMILPAFARSREEGRKGICKKIMQELGKALAAYRADNAGYFAFSWQRAGDPEPEGTGAANSAMAATSLGNLYPRYIQDAKLFHCPRTEDAPSFVLNLPSEYRRAGTPAAGATPQGSNWTLMGNQLLNPRDAQSTAIRASSYGYDPRISPRAPGKNVVVADMDGSYIYSDYTQTQNHEGGQNVLFVDGHVRWSAGTGYPANFCSRDSNDNIFAEGGDVLVVKRVTAEQRRELKFPYRGADTYTAKTGERIFWDADTDSYLVDTDAVMLGASFEGYEHLHYPAQDRRASPPDGGRVNPPQGGRVNPQ